MGRLKFAAALLIASSGGAAAQTYYQGYTNQHGTYVQPHYQSAPNGNPYDNWSTRGNTNPYTGQPGYQNPQQQDLYGRRSYR